MELLERFFEVDVIIPLITFAVTLFLLFSFNRNLNKRIKTAAVEQAEQNYGLLKKLENYNNEEVIELNNQILDEVTRLQITVGENREELQAISNRLNELRDEVVSVFGYLHDKKDSSNEIIDEVPEDSKSLEQKESLGKIRQAAGDLFVSFEKLHSVLSNGNGKAEKSWNNKYHEVINNYQTLKIENENKTETYSPELFSQVQSMLNGVKDEVQGIESSVLWKDGIHRNGESLAKITEETNKVFEILNREMS